MKLVALSLECYIFCLRLACATFTSLVSKLLLRLTSLLFAHVPHFFVNRGIWSARTSELAIHLVVRPGALVPAAIRFDLLTLTVSLVIEPFSFVDVSRATDVHSNASHVAI